MNSSQAPKRSSAATELITASENAQLLVLGTCGHGEFASLILGSVSLECIAHAHPPVLTARAQ
ncbi:universal stress protein [Brevibacterium sp. ZH18]|nr:universal stress protein [Brevibacterium sp. ZH18]